MLYVRLQNIVTERSTWFYSRKQKQREVNYRKSWRAVCKRER